MADTKKLNAPAALSGEPVFFKALTEINMIAHLASNEFRHLLPKGLTEAQFGVLNRLVRLEASETVSELAEAFQVAQPTMTSTLKKLSAKELVTITRSAGDSRVKIVEITAAGRGLRKKTIDQIAPLQAQISAEAPDIEWENIMPVLTALRVYLDHRRIEGLGG